MIAWKIVKEPTYSFLKFPMKKNVHSSRLKLRYISNTILNLNVLTIPIEIAYPLLSNVETKSSILKDIS